MTPTSAPVREVSAAGRAPQATRPVGETYAGPPGERRHLSNREHEILTLVALGLSERQIGERLHISPLTVKAHKARIADKLDSSGESSHSVAIGWERGYLRHAPRPLSPAPLLSPREYQVLICLAQGLTNPQIGARLHLSGNTAKTHVGSLMRKLGVSSRAHAVLRGFQTRLLPATPRGEGS